MFQPSVTVIIPCRNERWHIEECLRSLWQQDYPHNRLEALVIDGESHDGTQAIIEKLAPQAPITTRLISNRRRSTPSAMNLGIQEATGEYIIRLDAHTRYSTNYIAECIKHSLATGAANVGGAVVTCPAADSAQARGIVCGLTSVFGVGNSRFRIGTEIPIYVDTLPFGCFKKDLLIRIGLYDDAMLRAEDYELNLRIRKSGGQILLVPSIISHYTARDSVLKVFKTYFQYGQYKTAIILKHGPASIPWRQYVPLLFVFAQLSLLASLAISGYFLIPLIVFNLFYLLIATIFLSRSALSSISRKAWVLMYAVLTVMAVHFGNGLGNIAGLLMAFASKITGRKRLDLPLTR